MDAAFLQLHAELSARVRDLEARVRELELRERPSGTTAPPRTEREHAEREKRRMLEALNATGWNRLKAAELAGMPRRTFYRRMTEHGILEPPQRRAQGLPKS